MSARKTPYRYFEARVLLAGKQEKTKRIKATSPAHAASIASYGAGVLKVVDMPVLSADQDAKASNGRGRAIMQKKAGKKPLKTRQKGVRTGSLKQVLQAAIDKRGRRRKIPIFFLDGNTVTRY